PLLSGDGLALAERAGADVGRAVTHEEQHRHRRGDRRDEHERQARAPAVRRGDVEHPRHENELSDRCRGAEQPDDEAAMRAEPAMRDRRAGDLARDAGADADEHTPEQVELPQVAQRKEQIEADGDHPEATEERAARPDAVDEGPADRPAEPEGYEADRDGE